MREYITSDDICNQISMERTVFKGTFLVVEGVTDERLFEKFIDKDQVKIIEAHWTGSGAGRSSPRCSSPTAATWR